MPPQHGGMAPVDGGPPHDRRPCMNHVAAILGMAAILCPSAARAEVDAATRKLAHDLFKQLVEINTTDSTGSVTAASEAMAQHFRAAGFPESDIHVVGPNERKKNLVVGRR